MKNPTTKLVPTAVEIPTAKRSIVIDMLNQTLADLTDLKTHAKQAHWNVQGENFFSYHKLFDKVAEAADGFADDVAERCAQIGGFVNGRLSDAAKSTSLTPFPDGITQDHKCLEALLESLSTATESCRKNIESAQEAGDYATSDMYIDITRGFDKLLWMLNASSL